MFNKKKTTNVFPNANLEESTMVSSNQKYLYIQKYNKYQNYKGKIEVFEQGELTARLVSTGNCNNVRQPKIFTSPEVKQTASEFQQQIWDLQLWQARRKC